MLKFKFSRVGKSGQQQFRIIVQEHTKDPWGTVLDNVGIYDPRTKKATLDTEKIKKYLANGTQTTDSIHNLFVTNGLISGKKKNVSKVTKKIRKDAEDLKKKEIEDKAKAEKAAADAKVAEAKATEDAKAAEAKAAEEAKAAPQIDESAPPEPTPGAQA